MKPMLQGIKKNSRRDVRAGSRKDRSFPKTDCHYQTTSLADFNGRCARRDLPSFRKISEGYFKNEAPQNFVGEAVLFGFIIITAAVPVLSSVHALLQLVRGTV